MFRKFVQRVQDIVQNPAVYKKFYAALIASLTLLTTILPDGITGTEWVQLFVVIVSPPAVYQLENDKQ